MEELFRFHALRAPEIDPQAPPQALSLETDSAFQLTLSALQGSHTASMSAMTLAKSFAVARRDEVHALLDEQSEQVVVMAMQMIRGLLRKRPESLEASITAIFERLRISPDQLLERLTANGAEQLLADVIVALRIWNPSPGLLREMWNRDPEPFVSALVDRFRAIHMLRVLIGDTSAPGTAALMGGGTQFEKNLVVAANGSLISKFLDLIYKGGTSIFKTPTLHEQLADARAVAVDLAAFLLRVEHACPHQLAIVSKQSIPRLDDDVSLALAGDYADLPERIRDVLDPDGDAEPLGLDAAWTALYARYETYAKQIHRRIDTLVLQIGPTAALPLTAGPSSPEIAGFLRVAGVTDVKVIRHHVVGYQGAELAHIENVLEGEHRNRKFRTLDRREEETSSESETATTEESEIKTEDKSSLKTSLDEVLKETIDLKVGFDLKAKVGVVELGLNTSFAYSRSKEETKKQAAELARDVTNRAARKVTETVKTLQRTKRVHETEEIIEHGFENDKADAENVSGLYQWVEKTYRVQQWTAPNETRSIVDGIVLQPGQRLLAAPAPNTKAVELPPALDVTPGDIHSWNYQSLAARFGATVPTPPPLASTISLSVATPQNLEHGDDLKDRSYAFAQDLAVAENAKASWCTVTVSGEINGEHDYENVLVVVGPRRFDLTGKGDTGSVLEGTSKSREIMRSQTERLDGECGLIPCTVYAGTVLGYAAAVELTCVRTTDAYESWQLAVFGALQAARDKAMQAYDERVARAAVEQAYAVGPSPGAVDATIREELKRCAIAILANPKDPQAFYAQVSSDYASGNSSELARRILFFEQALEWENMTWVLYPYYWADNAANGWLRHNDRDEDNAELVEFLRAGAARLVVPVRPLPEDAGDSIADFSKYLSDVDLPALASLLDVKSPLYLAIEEELKARSGATDEVYDNKEWEVTVPTELVRLLPTNASLPAWIEELDASGQPIKGKWTEVEEQP